MFDPAYIAQVEREIAESEARCTRQRILMEHVTFTLQTHFMFVNAQITALAYAGLNPNFKPGGD